MKAEYVCLKLKYQLLNIGDDVNVSSLLPMVT